MIQVTPVAALHRERSLVGRARRRAIGPCELFDEIYGNDIIDRWRTNVGYHRRILEHSRVRAQEAATVDDQERFLK